MSKILVAYFSCSGVTQKLAENIAKNVNGELYQIKPQTPYTSADLNWNNANSRSSVEMNNLASRPALADKNAKVEEYDVIFVGFPIWWYVAPTIINTFLESYDFSGKTVIPFATSGSSGMGKTEQLLFKSCSSTTKWKQGKVLSAYNVTAVKDWVNSLNL